MDKELPPEPNVRESPRLPALPPLQQRKSMVIPNAEGECLMHESKDQQIRWNNAETLHHARSSPRKSPSRRPPPPLVTDMGRGSNSGQSEYTSVINEKPSQNELLPETAKTIYSSPFINRPALKNKEIEQPQVFSSQVYKSPFIGDPSVFKASWEKSSPEMNSLSEPSPSSLDYEESSPTNSFEISNMSLSTIFTQNQVMPNVLFDDSSQNVGAKMKALPPLPPREIFSAIQPVNRSAAIGSRESIDVPMGTQEDLMSPLSAGKFNWSVSDKGSTKTLDLYYKQPPKMGINNERQVSDSITSYYSNSSYAFNKSSEEFTRHESFGSITGNRLLNSTTNITVPTHPFSINLLDEHILYQCYNISLLSHVYKWILKIYFEWFNEYVFGKIEFFQMIQLLLEFHLPNSCEQDVIDNNVDKIIDSLVTQDAIRFEQDPQTENTMTIIVAGLDVQGVFSNLLSCYSFTHTQEGSIDKVHCYSYLCICVQNTQQQRSDLKISEFINKSVGIWTDYWKLSPSKLAEINPKEVKRQSFIFDLIVLEERSLNLATAAVEIYGASFDPGLLPNDPNFGSMAFDIFVPLIELHRDFLLSPILWKLKVKGKFIDGVGKIYLKWANEAKNVYIKYAENMATIHEIINWEKKNDTKFAAWLKVIDSSNEITRSKLYHDVIFFGGFFKSLQNMPVTLHSVLKCTDPSMDDYEYLKLAIEEIEKLSTVVDKVHGDAIDRRNVVRLARQLIVTSKNGNTINYINLQTKKEGTIKKQDSEYLDIKLGDNDRRLIKSGILYKKRDLWLENVPVHAFLLDNFFLLTEETKKACGTTYKLLERPIPIDYLSLEAKDDLRNKRQHPIEVNDDQPPQFHNTTPKKPQLIHAATTMGSIPRAIYQNATNTVSSSDDGDESSFSFKIRNTASNESFTFSLPTAEERELWVSAIVKSFETYITDHNKQVFNLKCLSDSFSYDEVQAPTNLPVEPDASVIGLAVKDFYSDEKVSIDITIKGDISCALNFQYENETFSLCGVNHGVYMALTRNPRVWKRIIDFSKVTRLEINSKLGLLFVLADRKLCHFNIPSIISAFYGAQQYLPANKLIGVMIQEKISFFKIAEDFSNSRHLFYERKGKIFVMTPEFDLLTKVFKFFKPYKAYKLPASNNGLLFPNISDIAIFKKNFIVSTSKGVILYSEAFNDDGIFLPDLRNDDSKLKSHHLSFKNKMETQSKKNSSKEKMVEYVKSDITSNKTKPISCFQLSPNDFIICYDEAIVKVNRHGEISNWKLDILVLDFYCTSTIMIKNYLVLSGDNLVQVYDMNFIEDSHLILSSLTPVQIIKGKKIRLLSSGADDACIVLTHPTIAGRQLLLEFSLSR